MAIVFARNGIRSRADPADRTYRCAPGRTIRPVLPGVARTAGADPGCRIPVLGSAIGGRGIGNVFTWRLGPKEQFQPFEV